MLNAVASSRDCIFLAVVSETMLPNHQYLTVPQLSEASSTLSMSISSYERSGRRWLCITPKWHDMLNNYCLVKSDEHIALQTSGSKHDKARIRKLNSNPVKMCPDRHMTKMYWSRIRIVSVIGYHAKTEVDRSCKNVFATQVPLSDTSYD